MENEELIRDQMEDTRTSLTDKLEKLEEKVVNTVQEATGAVSDTVAAVKETASTVTESVGKTVEAVKETVQDTVDSVKSSVTQGVSAVKGAFDIRSHTENHPWLMTGGAALTGFLVGKLLMGPPTRGPRVTPAHDMPELASSGSPVVQSRGPGHNGGAHRNGGHHRDRKAASHHREEKSWLQGLLEHFAPELNKFKAMALGMVINSVKDMARNAVPQQFQAQLDDVFEQVSHKVHEDVTSTHEESSEHTPSYEAGEERHRERGGERLKKGSTGRFDRQ